MCNQKNIILGQAQHGHGAEQRRTVGSPDAAADDGSVARATGQPDAGPDERRKHKRRRHESNARTDAESVAGTDGQPNAGTGHGANGWVFYFC